MRFLLPLAVVLCCARADDDISIPTAEASQLLSDLRIECPAGHGLNMSLQSVSADDVVRMLLDTHCGGTAPVRPGCSQTKEDEEEGHEAHAHRRMGKAAEEEHDEHDEHEEEETAAALMDANGDGILVEAECAAAWKALGLREPGAEQCAVKADHDEHDEDHHDEEQESHGRAARTMSTSDEHNDEEECLGYYHALALAAYGHSNSTSSASVAVIPSSRIHIWTSLLLNETKNPHCWEPRAVPPLQVLNGRLSSLLGGGVTSVGPVQEVNKGTFRFEMQGAAADAEALHKRVALKAGMSEGQVTLFVDPASGVITVELRSPEEEKVCNKLSEGEVWGYSLLGVFVVSVIGAGGCIVVAFIGLKAVVLEGLLAFSVGAMLGDSFFHAMPELLGLHSHGGGDSHESHAGHSDEEPLEQSMIRARMALVMGTVACFYIIDALIRAFFGPGHLHDSSPEVDDSTSSSTQNEPMPKSDKEPEEGEQSECRKRWCTFTPWHTIKTIGWINLGGDAVHNVTDGLAIAAAFHRSSSAGFATCIAVVTHEVATEVGDFAILLHSGMTPLQALVCNLLVACTAFTGCIVGAAIGSHVDNSEPWFLAIVIGSFIYLSVGVTLPELSTLVPRIQKKEEAESADGGENIPANNNSALSKADKPDTSSTRPTGSVWEVIGHVFVQAVCFTLGAGILFVIAVTEKESEC
eukprot:Hpha_TRINITY_DN16034_c0_g1::TRINITY_DN16034_c0_g1_i2::g.121098::m.121098/K14718/SLC39A12, ZIP12; solute carrier family 39 (zinc transporter), member 12